MNTPFVSLIIPVYNEEANLVWHHNVMSEYFKKKSIRYEILYVNDGSRDESLSILRKLHAKNKNVRYLSFSRNFGKEAATSAGLQHSKGNAAILLDADGQHPIEVLDVFIDEWSKGNKVIVGVRKNDKGEGAVKQLGSWFFYKILRILGGDSTPGLTDYCLIDRQVIDEFNKLSERNRVTRDLISWLGFSRIEVPFLAKERHAGTASYSFRKLFALAIAGIVKHSTRPLQLIGILGGAISFIAFLLLCFVVVEQYLLHDPLQLSITGTAVLALFLSLLVGVVLICQGLLALYIETVFYESQNRPLYIVEEEG